jgi:formate dehydrogenase major subunit
MAALARHRQAALCGAAQPQADISHPAMAVNLDACIQCTRCVRACREEQVNDVIGFAFRGGHSKIVFDLDDPMGASTCVACGECVQACPTGALAPAKEPISRPSTRRWRRSVPIAASVASSPITWADNEIVRVEGPRRPGESRAPVRQGPVRLRLRRPSAAA